MAADSSNGSDYYRLLSVGTGDDANVIKAAGGNIYSIVATNINAAVRYLKLYDKATAPATTDTPAFSVALPVGGVPVVVTIPEGLTFETGIGIRLVTGAADNDGTDVAAAEIMVNVGYR